MRGVHGRESLPRPMLQSVAALIEEQSGLALDEPQYRALDAAVTGRMDAAGVSDFADYLSLIRRARSGELRSLIELVANGETAFFRNVANFRALRDVVLPTLLAEASPPEPPPTLGGQGGQSPRRVVLWSAGCATGEEAYSLAIACIEAGLPSVAPVMVLGTDISRPALAAAERGEYSERHVSKVGPALRERYFDAVPRGWRVRGEVRSLVSWAPHNLLDPELPLPPESVDLLFCQNVTIYFRPATILQVTERLASVLRKGGHFFPGFSETPWCRASGLEMVSFGDCFAYRKEFPPAGTAECQVRGRRARRLPATGSRRAEARRGGCDASADGSDTIAGDSPSAETGCDESPDGVPGTPRGAAAQSGDDAVPDARLESARRAASEGDVARALREVDAALEADPMLPEVWELFGLLQRQAGRRDEAERGFRRQLYLASDSPLPHFHLATLFRERGWTKDARREYDRAARILEAMPPATQLAGVTADLLLRACRRFAPAGDQSGDG